jgi:hypothetical protein
MSCYITDEIEKLKLAPAEKMLLSYYKYFTEQGSAKCCMLTNEELADRIGIGIASLYRVKKHLKDLGYIYSNGGIKVWFKRLKKQSQNDSTSTPHYQNDSIDYQNNSIDYQNDSEPYQNDSIDYQIETHNKKKEEKEKKKKGACETEFNSNFDYIFSKVKYELRTEENKSYLLNKFKERIDYINSISRSELSVSNLISQVEYIIRKISYDEWEQERVENKKKYIEELKRVSGLFE